MLCWFEYVFHIFFLVSKVVVGITGQLAIF